MDIRLGRLDSNASSAFAPYTERWFPKYNAEPYESAANLMSSPVKGGLVWGGITGALTSLGFRGLDWLINRKENVSEALIQRARQDRSGVLAGITVLFALVGGLVGYLSRTNTNNQVADLVQRLGRRATVADYLNAPKIQTNYNENPFHQRYENLNWDRDYRPVSRAYTVSGASDNSLYY